MRNIHAEFGDADGNKETVFGISPDLAEALAYALRGYIGVHPPSQAHTFDDLTATIAQTSRVIQHLEAFRELAMVEADKTSPHADRKAIAIAAAMPPSRLYRVLDKHGRPKNRKGTTMTFTSRDLTDQVTTATDASDGTYDVPAIVEEIIEKHGAVDVDSLDSDEFWGIVGKHATA